MVAKEIDHLIPLRTISPETHPWRRRWLGTCVYWSLQSAGWGGFFLLSISSLLVVRNADAYADVQDSLGMTLAGITTTHMLRVVLIRLRGRPQTWRGLALKLLPWLAASGLAIGSAVSWSVICLEGASESEMAMYSATGGEYAYLDMVTRGCFFAAVWVALYFGFHFYREHREGILEREKLQTAAREAQLNALRAQLNPHFLFNSLNVIRAMVPAELSRPREAVTSLSELLRATLRQGAEPWVTLGEELAMVDHHLRLEQFRHEERLRVERWINVEAFGCAVPPFAVQTLVENAINHGIAQRKAGGVVKIVVELEGERLRVEITNPGRLGRSSDSTGVGLANVRARLALLWGERASLTLEQAAEDLVRARLTMPVVRMDGGTREREETRGRHGEKRREGRDEISIL
jgi:two-component system LytT family sensor kinase